MVPAHPRRQTLKADRIPAQRRGRKPRFLDGIPKKYRATPGQGHVRGRFGHTPGRAAPPRSHRKPASEKYRAPRANIQDPRPDVPSCYPAYCQAGGYAHNRAGQQEWRDSAPDRTGGADWASSRSPGRRAKTPPAGRRPQHTPQCRAYGLHRRPSALQGAVGWPGIRDQ